MAGALDSPLSFLPSAGAWGVSVFSCAGLFTTDSVVSYSVQARASRVPASSKRASGASASVRISCASRGRRPDAVSIASRKLRCASGNTRRTSHRNQSMSSRRARKMPRNRKPRQRSGCATPYASPSVGAPRAAKERPSLDTEQRPQLFHVADERIDAVVFELAERRGLAAAALVEEHDPPLRRIQHFRPLQVHRPARPAVDDQHRRHVARTLRAPVDRVAVAHVEHAFVEIDCRFSRHICSCVRRREPFSPDSPAAA